MSALPLHMAAKNTIRDLVVSARVVKSERKDEWIDSLAIPPADLCRHALGVDATLAGVMLLVMVSAAERHGPFVGSFLSAPGFAFSVNW